MSERRDPATYNDFDELLKRLDGILGEVKAKDVTIEASLDLMDEGIALALRATDLLEKPDFTDRERSELDAAEQGALEGDETPEDRLDSSQA